MVTRIGAALLPIAVTLPERDTKSPEEPHRKEWGINTCLHSLPSSGRDLLWGTSLEAIGPRSSDEGGAQVSPPGQREGAALTWWGSLHTLSAEDFIYPFIWCYNILSVFSNEDGN